VSEALADDLRVHALGEHQRGMRVAQVMKTDARQTAALQRRLKRSAHIAVIQSRPDGRGEDEVGLFPCIADDLAMSRLCEPALPQNVHDAVPKRDHAAPALGLWLAFDHAVARPLQRRTNRGASIDQVDVAPA